MFFLLDYCRQLYGMRQIVTCRYKKGRRVSLFMKHVSRRGLFVVVSIFSLSLF